MKHLIPKLALVGTAFSSMLAWVVVQLPGDRLGDKVTSAFLIGRIYAFDLMWIGFASLAAALAYLSMPHFFRLDTVRRFNPRNGFSVPIALLAVGAIFCAVFLFDSAIRWAKYNYVYFRDAEPISLLRREMFRSALVAQAGGDLELAIDRFEQFGRIFPDRAKANRIDSVVAVLRQTMQFARELSDMADEVEQRRGTSHLTLALRVSALAQHPGNAMYREKLRTTVGEARTFLASASLAQVACKAGTEQSDRQLAHSALAVGFALQDQLFSGPADLPERTKLICALLAQVEVPNLGLSWRLEGAESLLESTTSGRLKAVADRFYWSGVEADEYSYYQADVAAMGLSLTHKLFLRPSRADAAEEVEELQSDEADVAELSERLLRPVQFSGGGDKAEERGTESDAERAGGSTPQELASGKRDSFRMFVDDLGKLFACWTDRRVLPDVMLGGARRAVDEAPVGQCSKMVTSARPVNLESSDARDRAVVVLSSAASRVARESVNSNNERLRRSLCTLVALVGNPETLASEAVEHPCSLEIGIALMRR